MPSFARTKILPPRASAGSLIARPALEQRLAAALQQLPLVLVSAAAGYGKTSAVVQALDRLPRDVPIAWVACDAGDTPLQLFSCLVAALDPCDLPWRTSPEALVARALANAPDGLTAGTRSLRAMAAELINALDAADVPHGVIVVDDLHRIDHPAVYQFLDLLLERFTDRWTMVLSTRHDPPIALHRLRAQGRVAVFDAHDLQFDPAQARAVAAAQGVDDASADALFSRTQGWPAGLQLALQVLRGAPGGALSGQATRIDRHVFDFFTTEVLDRLPAELREFLLDTAVLPELSAGRCAALTGDEHAAEHLETLVRQDLFVTLLDGPEPTLRLHDLLRDALQHRLQRSGAARLRTQLQRAAASEPEPPRRLAYLVRAGDWPAAARELHLQSFNLLTASQSGTVLRWLDGFPPEASSELADLHIVRTLLAWMHWRWDDMLTSAQAAAQAFERDGRPLDALAARAYAALALRSTGTRAHSDSVLDEVTREVNALLQARQAEHRAGRRWDGQEPGMMAAMLGREAAVWCAYDDARFDELAGLTAASLELLDLSSGVAPMFQMLPLPGYAGLRGMRPLLQRYVRSAQARLGPDDAHLGTLVQAIDASVRLWAGEVEGAVALLRDAAEDVRWHDYPLRTTLHVLPFLCLADALRGDTPALRTDAEVLQSALMRAAAQPDIGLRVATELFQLGRCLHAGGEVDAAVRLWRHVASLDDSMLRPRWQVQRDALDGWIAWAEGDVASAERSFTDSLRRLGSQLDLFGQATELRLRSASARLQLGHGPAAAAETLGPVFERHAGDADIAAVWLAGPVVLAGLAATDWQGALPASDVDTLRRWAASARLLRSGHAAAEPVRAREDAPPVVGVPAGPPPVVMPMEGLLSPREWEVLDRLAAGDSNKLIARAFDLSPHTVKRHVANILLKLDLRSRGQAAAWYHAHRP